MQTIVGGIDRGLAGECPRAGWSCRANVVRGICRSGRALMLCLCTHVLFIVLFVGGCGSLGETLLATAAPQSGEPGTQVGPTTAVDDQVEPALDPDSDSSADPETQPGGEEGIDPETDSEADSGTQTSADPETGPVGNQAADGGTEPETESVTNPVTEPVMEPGGDDSEPEPDSQPESTPLEQARLACEQTGINPGAIDATFTFAQAAAGSGFTAFEAIAFVRTPCVAACSDPLTICELACTDCAVAVIDAVSGE